MEITKNQLRKLIREAIVETVTQRRVGDEIKVPKGTEIAWIKNGQFRSVNSLKDIKAEVVAINLKNKKWKIKIAPLGDPYRKYFIEE